MEDKATVIDLTHRVTTPLNETRHEKFRAVPSEHDSDIYARLGIDPSRSMFRAHNVIGRDDILALALVSKSHYGNQYYDQGKDNMLVPSGDVTSIKARFRASDSYGDWLTATASMVIRGMDHPLEFSCSSITMEAVFGMVFEPDGNVCLNGKFRSPYGNVVHLLSKEEKYHPISFGAVERIYKKYFRKTENLRNIFIHLMRTGVAAKFDGKTDGITKAFALVAPFYEQLWQEEESLLIAVFHSLLNEIKRTINGVKVSQWFNAYFKDTASCDEFKSKLRKIVGLFLIEGKEDWQFDDYHFYYYFDGIFEKLPGYADLRKVAINSQSGRALNKMMADVEFLNFDEEKYPLLAELIKDGSIPVSTFFRKEGEEAYFLFNNNWPLFEEFLRKHREAGIELAKLASQRTTYEKSFMSYLYFVLYGLPAYLKKHTGKDWTCLPKIVKSASELEPDKGSGGKTKKRSALTPIVDNDNCTVVVPYACLQVAGRSTTYTYSLNYSVIERGLSIDGDVSLIDVEEKLNGRDDYGLMFYTLTGSAPGRGYPSFLIIFERLANNETRVHFHRVHPMRSKDGDTNPVNDWIKTCYNWMVGNVNADRIVAQQGDLVFVSIDSLADGERTLVDSYDSHCFQEAVAFVPYTKKTVSNILGYFEIAADTVLGHSEHVSITVPAGIYELRQCRSWEANPKGIWTLRID